MAEDTLTGKTGDDLEKSLIQKQAKKAEQTTLKTGEKITPTTMKVEDKELIGDVTTQERTTTAAPDIDPDKYTQEIPTGTAATFDADKAAPKIKEAGKDVKGAEKTTLLKEIEPAQGTVSEDSLAKAATQELDPKATVKYQLAELYNAIGDGTDLPAWASPAVRKVSAIMAQRGLGASSMAAAAMVNAISESGIAIASADAQKYANIQLQNLNNQQQAAMQRAAVVAGMDTANLNNRQVAEVNNAKAFLALDTQNLSNEQQSNTLKYQSLLSSLLSDTAAENASRQFNAKSENEIETFFAQLGSQIETLTINRKAAVDQYNTSQKNAMAQFDTQVKAGRDQFNATMKSQIDQSNAVWRRNINTVNTSATNEANRQNVLNMLGINQTALNNLWQTYRDQAAWSMQISENNLDRAHNAAMQSAQISASASAYDQKYDDFLKTKTIDNIFG